MKFYGAGSSRTRYYSLMGAAVLLFGLLCSVRAQAAPMPWKAKNFQYTAENQKITDVLKEFAASQGVPIVISPEVEGTVNAKFNLPPAKMMELVSSSFGLIWYFDGTVLHIYPASIMKTELIRLNQTKIVELQNSVESLKIYDPRFPLVVDSVQGTVVVSGPPRYVDMVIELAKVIDDNAGRRGEAEVRVFALKYAWASDTVLTQAGSDVVIPGIAQTLSEIFGTGNSKSSSKKRPINTGVTTSRSPAESLNKLRGTGLNLDIPDLKLDSGITPGSSSDQKPDFFDGGLPRFRADSVRNVVIVRDLPERMGMYEKLIQQLDVMPGLVEIEAQIVEISSTALEEIGVEWRAFRSGVLDIQTGTGKRPQLREATSVGVSSPFPTPNDEQLTPKGGLFTVISGDARKFLMARINAMEEQGSARTLSRPRVLTLDNVQALLEDTRKIFVRIAGNLEVGLFNINVGTSLRVTPLIVEEKDVRRVKLSVRIEDGSTLPDTVDQIPATRSSAIGTQAFINEGQSLLIAGYSVESETKTNTGVPGLSKIPGIGALFRSDGNRVEKSERLFLITPRIVKL